MIFIFIVLALSAALYFFFGSARFGKLATGQRLQQMMASPHYKDGQFQNLSHTPALTEGMSYYPVLKEFIFHKSKRNKPGSKIPGIKTDLKVLNPSEDLLVWFGHSSYYLQLDGKKILVDPVFSGHASPVKFTTKSFEGTDIYTADDIPEIDFLFISHDHWDHLDYSTVLQLQPKVTQVFCGLGVGTHLEKWGYTSTQIIERDWNQTISLQPGFSVKTFPGRHFSGRAFKKNTSLWLSFALTTPSYKIFLGGDSGYDTHFKKIGEEAGPFDLAILECGQYDKSWKYIHMMPEETAQAAVDLKAKKLMPVHWAKFALGNHDWDDPIIRVSAAAAEKNIPLLTPRIGAVTNISDNILSKWWEGID